MSRDRAKTVVTAARQWLSALLIVTALTSTASALSVARKKQIARTQFDQAERMREALNGRPEKERKERDYQKVMDAYRKVYYVAPTSSKADAAIVAVAELLVEKGRQFHNQDTLKDAIGQYEFLRKEYPGSRYRVEALFTIAQIYKDDLNDSDKAKETFQEFLKHYPKSDLASDARDALKDIDNDALAKTTDKPKEKQDKLAQLISKKEDSKKDEKPAEEDHATKVLVTGIRHWSTPDYTRVAIDVEQEVQFETGRIPSPDRIYFDLKDTKVSSVLKGKAFDVDDGFLKKIRIAQFAPGLTRVVLDVGDDVGDYSAFLLPNPYRLVIDIHGKKPTKLMARTKVPNESERTPYIPKLQKPKAEPAKAAKAETPAAKPSTKTEIAASKSDNKPSQDTIAKAIEQKEYPKPAEVRETPIQAEVKETAKPEPAKVEAAKAEPPKPAPVETAAKKDVPTKVVENDSDDAKSQPKVIAKADTSEPKIKEELRPRGKKRQAASSRIHVAQPTMDGDRSLIRALGLKIGRIVVDAGHGGHDTGTIGPNGLLEKDLVLDVALRLGKALEDRLGAEVVYTRDDDTFIPLETRTAVANQQQADLFISIHANSSRDQSARGVETYYLNFTSSRDALEVAARENAVSDKSIHELQDLVKKIALKEKIEESREFAIDVQHSLHDGLATKAPAIRDRGVKKAPFIVLIGANMPSILAEISFISNPTDEKKLQTGDYRQKIADSLYKGVAKYISGLSGVKVAQKMPKEQGE